MTQTPSHGGAGAAGVPARVRPVERFLGRDEAVGGPFALLGLSPTATTDDLVLSALDRQIERIARHPECDTPEADEVRLAVHAAAAQLLDPVVRRHLVARWTGAAPPPPSRAPVPGPAPRRATSEKLLEADAILALALYGGWNVRSQRRLLKIAHARGLNNRQVATALRNLAGRRRPARPAPSRASLPMRRARTREEFEGAAPSSPTPPARPPLPPPQRRPAPVPPPEEEGDPGQALLRNALIFGGVGLAALLAVVVGIIALTTGTPLPPPATPTPAPSASGSIGAAPATKPPAPAPTPPAPDTNAKPLAPKHVALPPPSDTSDPALLVREIAACADAVQSETDEATSRFEKAIDHLASVWPQMPRDRLVACHDSIIEFMYKAGASPDATLRAIAAVGHGAAALTGQPTAADIAPAAWSTGMLLRLSRERDLTAAAKSDIEGRIGAALGSARPAIDQTFESGATAALSILPQRLTPPAAQGPQGAVDLDAWKKWIDAVEALAPADTPARQRLLLAGLEILLIQGPEPDASKGISDAVAEIVQRLTWRPQDESRRWLLRWFDDRRISPADLHAVTSALVTRSSAEGVDVTMVLSTSGSDKARADLRDRYANVWSMQQAVSRDELTATWVKAAKEALTAPPSADTADDLARAALLARLSESAWWLWRGEGAEAATIVADLKGPIERAGVSAFPPKTREDIAQTDGGWAEKYLAAGQKNRVKREMLEQISAGSGDLGPVDAEVIAREAVLGTVAELRTPSQEIVRRLADSPPMINALLELVPRMPRTPVNSALVAGVCQRGLPGVKDADWPTQARRVLVEKLLEAIANESPMAKVDRLAAIIALSYRSMASPAPLAADQRAPKDAPAASASAAQLWQKWRGAADAIVPTTPPPIPLDQIDRRRSGRISQARGMVQAFSAEQASLCEIMAYVINAEQPSRADQIRSILDRLADDRRHATGILEQINAAERAAVQLWLVRFQEDPA